MRLLVLTGALATALTCGDAAARVACPQPKRENLAGQWIGPGNAGAYARLELNELGHGLLVVEESAGFRPISAYRVAGVRINGYVVTFQLQPVAGAPATSLRAVAQCGLDLSRTLEGGSSWVQEFKLQRERTVLPRIEAVRDASRAYHAKPAR